MYPNLLKQAVAEGNDATLADSLRAPGTFVAKYVNSSTFEINRLLLSSQQDSAANYQTSIMEAVKVNDYETAEIIWSFFTTSTS